MAPLKHTERSGNEVFTGWITKFCFSDKDGKCLHDASWTAKDQRHPLIMDGLVYQPICSEDIRTVWSRLPVIVFDNGEVAEIQLFAGSMGIAYTSSNGFMIDDGSEFLDTLMPAQGE